MPNRVKSEHSVINYTWAETFLTHLSTNKVYGDTPNKLSLIEKKTRYEINPKSIYVSGISESMFSVKNKTLIIAIDAIVPPIIATDFPI